jgi:hypothetical protein
MSTLTKDELTAAREWLKECAWDDIEMEEFDELTDAQIERGIKRHFDGGLDAFLATCRSGS